MRLTWNLQPKRYNQIVVGVFAIAVFLVFSLNFVVDPFNKNGVFRIDVPRASISKKMNYQLYKVLEYAQDPQPVLLLGDSRANSLKQEMFENADMPNVYNFAYGGGTLFEAIDTFWYATKIKKINRVIFCVPFNLYDESNNLNRMPQAVQISQSVTYYFSTMVSKTSIINLLAVVTGKELKSEKPPMSKAAFWSQLLGPTTKRFYGSWVRPRLLQDRMDEVVRHCEANDIELVFLLPPTHIDLQKKVHEFGLDSEYQRYKELLSTYGTVFDFDFPSRLTENKDNFKDPYHFNSEVAQYIVNVLGNRSPPSNDFRVSQVAKAILLNKSVCRQDRQP